MSLWRGFDEWAMFSATPEVGKAIGVFFSVSDRWRDFARNPSKEADWQSAIENSNTSSAIELLAERQFQTFNDHFGSPVPMRRFLDAFERFGDNSLPDDIDRPKDVRHNMNGSGMWQMWSAFADACIRLSIRETFWNTMARGILLGQMNDGLFRGRFTVKGFERSSEGKVAMRTFVTDLSDADVAQQLLERFIDSGLG